MKDKETYTKEEVIEMLKDMQRKVCYSNGLIYGHVTQMWVIKDLLGDRIEQLGGKGIEIRNG